MSTLHLHSVTFGVLLSLMVSLTCCQSTSDHFFSVPKVPQLIAMLMLDSNLSGTRGRDLTQLPELGPYNVVPSPEDSELLYDRGDRERDDDVDVTLSDMSNSDEAFNPHFIKRGRYHTNKQNHIKRGSLSDLIRRLMALKGNSFTDGRITMMRFGTGRRK